MKPKTFVTFVVDRSGSMQHLGNPVVQSIKTWLDSLGEQKEQDIRVNYIQFDHIVDTMVVDAGLDGFQIPPYSPRGETSLLDAVMRSIELNKSIPVGKDEKDVSYLVLVLTDGLENHSVTKPKVVGDAIRQLQRRDNWTFTFQVPPGHKAQLVNQFGIPSDNVREWEGTTKGLAETTLATQRGFTSYFDARSKGQKSVKTFYVTTDLSELKPVEMKRELKDLSSEFDSALVPKEMDIKSFVEHVMKRPYELGTAYFQLTKPELIQGHKEILIMEKGKKAVWGGPEVRKMVGLPDDDSNTKVKPGNHANYDIFGQSTSVNRKLVRGTRVLVKK